MSSSRAPRQRYDQPIRTTHTRRRCISARLTAQEELRRAKDDSRKARAVSNVKDAAIEKLQREHAALESRHRALREEVAALEATRLQEVAASRQKASSLAASTPGYAEVLKERWRDSQRQVSTLQERVAALIHSEGLLRHKLGTSKVPQQQYNDDNSSTNNRAVAAVEQQQHILLPGRGGAAQPQACGEVSRRRRGRPRVPPVHLGRRDATTTARRARRARR